MIAHPGGRKLGALKREEDVVKYCVVRANKVQSQSASL